MNLRIGTKFSLLVAGIVSISSIFLGILVHKGYQDILLRRSLERLKYENNIKALELRSKIAGLSQDLRYLSGSPPIQGIPIADANGGVDPRDGSTVRIWKNRLQIIFAELMRAKPDYFQLRFIGAADNGREIVRVERHGTNISRVRSQGLQRKGNTEYFREAAKLKPGEVYLSNIDLNREHGKVVKPFIPVLRAATPVFHDDELFGIVVVNMDFRGIFRDFILNTPKSLTPFVTNDRGDFLAHPNPTKVFGFDRGEDHNIAQSHPWIKFKNPKDIRQSDEVFHRETSTKRAGNDDVASLVRIDFDPQNPDRYLGIILATSESELLNESIQLRTRSFLLIFGLVLVAILLSTWMASKLTKPLREIVKASEDFAIGKTDVLLPTKSNDEIGILARTFERMVRDVAARTRLLSDREAALKISNENLNEKTKVLETQKIAIEEAKLEIEEKAEALEQASRYKSEFLANMSHELRTPLNSLLLLSKDLADNKLKNLKPKQVEAANIIHDGGTALLVLINDILDLSKVEAGKLEIHPEKINLTSIMGELTRMFRPVAREKELEFEIMKSDDVTVDLFVDPVRLVQILNNFLSNAFKFTKEGKVTVSIYSADSNRIRFDIMDTGIGIDPKEHRQIFEAFCQADGSTTRQYGGTGLGLSICRQMAKLMNGEIRMQSQLEKGSTFSLIIPIKATTKNPSVTKSKPHLRLVEGFKTGDEQQEISLVDINALIVDDDPRNLYVLTKIFEERGATTVTAENGQQALRALKERSVASFDIVLMDLMMPIMDGYVAIRRIREISNYSSLPILALSAKAMPEDREKALIAGANSFLAKPFEASELLASVAKMVDFNKSVSLEGIRVLIADDEPQDREILRHLLKKKGCQMSFAADGEEAFRKCKKEKPQILILDLEMRAETDGWTCLKNLQSEKGLFDMKIIVVSGHDTSENIQTVLALGANAYVHKPVDRDHLLKTMRDLVFVQLRNVG